MEKNKTLTTLSQNLRTNATKEENTLWYQYLRNYPVQFRRQCVFGPYIVDFYCAKALLVVELDGSQHYDPAEMAKDAQRTEYLESLGLKVIRFPNNDVNERLESVCEVIDTAVAERYSAEPASRGMGRGAFSAKQIIRGAPLIRPLRGHLPPRGKVSLRCRKRMEEL